MNEDGSIRRMKVMNADRMTWACVVVLGLSVGASEALAQNSRVSYGRITAVRQVDLQNQGAAATGAVVGGLAGLASGGSGRSSSNRALRTIGGAAVGSRVGAAAGSSTGFEYTVLIGAQTIRLVTEKAGLRVGDCVSVEQGQFNNIRLAPDDRCAAGAGRTQAVPAADASEADACAQATQQVLDAQTDDDFARAERRMRLLCE
jgi:outer membrane lipoprotein SlyB